MIRFIPAGAGNTPCSSNSRAIISGLSPLARGTPGCTSGEPCPARFIPAGAGNTQHDGVSFSLIAVYPRWRGEHTALCCELFTNVGLSPLARGTPTFCQRNQATDRFIPAGAGNTQLGKTALQPRPVYPRWRGEHANHAGGHRKALRFIPAGAGNTRYTTRITSRESVYPRWRGEHFHVFIIAAASLGLSPLARGTHPIGMHIGDDDRFIPAGAGNTSVKTICSLM